MRSTISLSGGDRVIQTLVITGVLAACFLAFLTHAPNRLVTGVPIPVFDVLNGPRLWVFLPAILIAICSFLPQRLHRSLLMAASATLFSSCLFYFAGRQANELSDPAIPASRVSVGGAFWLLLFVCWMVVGQAVRQAQLSRMTSMLLTTAFFAPLILMLTGGWMDDMSILKEYANRRDVFWEAVGRHLEIVLLTLGFSLAIGVPLGIAAWRRPELQGPLFSTFGVIQTVPSIALFGLLIPPLAAISAGLPLLTGWGIGGIGLTPAIIALTLYSLLPITRSVVIGLNGAPAGLIEAAQGIGFGARRIFWSVEVPIAMPVLLSGMRVCLVQTIGLAVIAALIGAGGLGSIMFQGLLSSAIDLVLLGVIPVVLMATVVDAGFRLAIDLTGGNVADPV